MIILLEVELNFGDGFGARIQERGKNYDAKIGEKDRFLRNIGIKKAFAFRQTPLFINQYACMISISSPVSISRK